METLDTTKRIPIVSLGDGTWVLLDELPTIMFLTEEEIANMDEAPVPCDETDHIHIQELLNNSHWNDTCNAIVTNKDENLVSILALAMCDVIDACSTCYFLASKQVEDLMEHPQDMKKMRKLLKKLALDQQDSNVSRSV